MKCLSATKKIHNSLARIALRLEEVKLTRSTRTKWSDKCFSYENRAVRNERYFRREF